MIAPRTPALLLAVAACCWSAPARAAAGPSYCGECLDPCGDCGGCRCGEVCQNPSLAAGACRACLHLGNPCVAGPTPGTCTADGVCYPRKKVWGHYEGRWARWPGDYDDPLPPRARQLQAGEVPPQPEIDPTVEDKEAPPPVDDDTNDGAADGPVGPGPGVGNPLPPLRPLGSPPPRPGASGQGEDPPPELPTLPGFDRPLRGRAPTPRDGLSRRRPLTPARPPAVRPAVHRLDRDPPPSLPAAFRIAPRPRSLPEVD